MIKISLIIVTLILNSLAFSASADNRDIYTAYPLLGDNEPFSYPDKRVSTVIEKGLVRELIIQCTKETEGIMVHDHISSVFCDSNNECHSTLRAAINATCK